MIDFEKNCVMKAAFCALKLRRLLLNICATSIVVLVSREISSGALNPFAFDSPLVPGDETCCKQNS